MEELVLQTLRNILIDRALDRGDKDWFLRLTGPEWQSHVVKEPPVFDNPYEFLEKDGHFIDKRIVDWMSRKTFVNYRFLDETNGIVYIGEIRIPVLGSDTVETRFRPRPMLKEHVIPVPTWFQGLETRVRDVFQGTRVGS